MHTPDDFRAKPVAITPTLAQRARMVRDWDGCTPEEYDAAADAVDFFWYGGGRLTSDTRDVITRAFHRLNRTI